MTLLPRSEEMILLAVWKLQDDASGMTIRRYLSDVTGSDLAIASIYAPLDRLMDKGYLRPVDGPPTKERGGRRRRFYRLTPAGLDALGQMHRVHDALWAGFPKFATE
jgi:DNA-binding PadR family transcriptional regulator